MIFPVNGYLVMCVVFAKDNIQMPLRMQNSAPQGAMSVKAAIHASRNRAGVFGVITLRNASFSLCTQVNISLDDVGNGLTK